MQQVANIDQQLFSLINTWHPAKVRGDEEAPAAAKAAEEGAPAQSITVYEKHFTSCGSHIHEFLDEALLDEALLATLLVDTGDGFRTRMEPQELEPVAAAAKAAEDVSAASTDVFGTSLKPVEPMEPMEPMEPVEQMEQRIVRR